jgi:hypothetical protein
MQCLKCGKSFIGRVVIDGKERNLKSRKYCLECSPFGVHNTKSLLTTHASRNCLLCGKLMLRKSEKGKVCWVCANRRGREKKIEKLKGVVGTSCWFCGYARCWAALEFHHVYPDQKLFGLTTRELQFSWDRILIEAKKCVLACACCHREIHCGLISTNFIVDKWQEKWSNAERT